MKKRKVSIYACVCILIACVGGCSGNASPSIDTESTVKSSELIEPTDVPHPKWGLTYDEYNCPIDFPEEEECLKIADSIMNGSLIVHETITDTLPYEKSDLKNFDWEVQYTNSPNTFQLYLQCLNPVAYLTKAFEITENAKYIDLASEFLNSWVEYKEVKAGNNPFLWYDHGTALRAEILIYYVLVLEKNSLCNLDVHNRIEQLLIEHGEFLADATKYTENHNHGIFQDRALIYISHFLDGDKVEEWFCLAKERLQGQLEFAFNEESVHVENSPGYAFGVMDLFLHISEFLLQFDDSFGEELCSAIYDSAEFMSWTIKPNGVVAEIGDTSSVKDYYSSYSNDLSKYSNESLTYVASLGESGSPPKQTATIYPLSGYYFSRMRESEGSFRDATWCMFKAGYSTKTHKHADDVSFMLYSKGFDIFVDPGWYSYVTGEKYRDYFVSSKAHNTVIVDGKTYSTTTENSSKVGILDYEITDEYEYVLGYNDMYAGVEIDRHFYHSGDSIVLFDNIVSEEKHEYSQLFHLSEVMRVISYDDNEVVLAIEDTDYIVRIKQYGDIPISLDVIYGTSDTEYGHISRSLNLLDEIVTLKFNATGSWVDFITVITIEDENGCISLNNNCIAKEQIFFSKEDNMIDFGGHAYQLKERERFSAEQVTLKTEGNVLTASNNLIRDDLSYCFYLIDKNSAATVFKTSYSSDPTFSCEVPVGEYLLKSYVRSREGQRKASIIAYIKNDGEHGIQIIQDEELFWNLEYIGHSMVEVEERVYEFNVDFNYSWNANIKWYVYRNGGYFDAISSTERKLIYEFDEPGTYTIMYYLTTPSGDNQFWNFPEFTISS